MPSSTDQTINIPQLLIVLLLGGLAIRYFFFSSSPGSDIAADRSSAARRLRAREADVERVQQMFPQIPRRTIMWDLQRNGGNVVATTERILSGRGLEVVSLLLCLLSIYQTSKPSPPPLSPPLLQKLYLCTCY
jgi:coupling of ubiquitin conjugation to ER degradation protein 1